MRQSVYTRFIFGLCVLSRASLLSAFCPSVDDVELPDPADKDDDGNSAYDADGMPQFINVWFHRWKGNGGKKAQVRVLTLSKCVRCAHTIHARPQKVMIRRNTVHPEYCVVVQLLLFLQMANITHGPIFPDCTDNVHTGVTLGMKCTEQKHIRNLKDMFVYVGGGLAACTSHSVRVAGVSWAARCGLTTDEIKVIGRWAATSESFIRYFQHGAGIAKKYMVRLHTTSDPVFALWRFPTTHMELVITGSRVELAQKAAAAALLQAAS